jgi:hypothetical protein
MISLPDWVIWNATLEVGSIIIQKCPFICGTEKTCKNTVWTKGTGASGCTLVSPRTES